MIKQDVSLIIKCHQLMNVIDNKLSNVTLYTYTSHRTQNNLQQYNLLKTCVHVKHVISILFESEGHPPQCLGSRRQTASICFQNGVSF